MTARDRRPIRLLLISNTGRPVLAHCRDVVLEFLGDRKSAAFITAASLDEEDAYFAEAQRSLVVGGPAGIVDELQHVRWSGGDGHGVIDQAEAVIVGGGNTFALLARLRQSGLLEQLRERVTDGLPYIGSSAGANIVGPNVLTSNDWNVVELTRFASLGLTEFNINPHYVERETSEALGSETRDGRIREYHVLWDNPVVGLEDGAVLRLRGKTVEVTGSGRAKVFKPSQAAEWFAPGARIEDLHRLRTG